MNPKQFARDFEACPFSTEVFAPDGTCLAVNRAWEQLWQMPRTILAGYNMLQDSGLHSKYVWPALSQGFGGEPTVTPPILYDPAENDLPGRPRWTQGFITPVVEEDGRTLRVILMLQDITDQQRVFQEMQRVARTLAEQMPPAIEGAALSPAPSYSSPSTPPGMPARLLPPPRELQVLRAISRGLSPKEIAFDLSLGVKTVYTLRSRLLTRLGLRTDAELIRFALLHGLSEPF